MEAALDTTDLAAADELRVWAEGQRTLYHRLRAERPDNRIGLDDNAYHEVMRQVAAVLERAGDSHDPHTLQAPQLRASVAAAPMVDTVGELRALLEQLTDEMPLYLDDHHRALPGEPDQVHTVHPILVATLSGLGTEAQHVQPGLMLTQVYVPFLAEEEQAAVATRDDLPAYGELPRAAHFLERGQLHPGLEDIAGVLQEVAHLVGEVAAGYVATGSDAADTLRVETERITHTPPVSANSPTRYRRPNNRTAADDSRSPGPCPDRRKPPGPEEQDPAARRGRAPPADRGPDVR
ncbi:hypothetical protein [Streptomyces tauricus]|uniref:hypothetical protein n=1 Tax=Streptomyces tauricus TaxID=68274 RepID=UPI00382EEA13